MELPSKILEQTAFNTKPKIEEHMVMVMDKSSHEKHLYQPLQTNNKQFKTVVTFLTGYNRIFNVTNSKKSSVLRKHLPAKRIGFNLLLNHQMFMNLKV